MGMWLIAVIVVMYLMVGSLFAGIVFSDDMDGGLLVMTILFWPFAIMAVLGIVIGQWLEK